MVSAAALSANPLLVAEREGERVDRRRPHGARSLHAVVAFGVQPAVGLRRVWGAASLPYPREWRDLNPRPHGHEPKIQPLHQLGARPHGYTLAPAQALGGISRGHTSTRLDIQGVSQN